MYDEQKPTVHDFVQRKKALLFNRSMNHLSNQVMMVRYSVMPIKTEITESVWL